MSYRVSREYHALTITQVEREPRDRVFYPVLSLEAPPRQAWEKRGALPREWLENDSDLDSLRDEPRFQALMARL